MNTRPVSLPPTVFSFGLGGPLMALDCSHPVYKCVPRGRTAKAYSHCIEDTGCVSTTESCNHFRTSSRGGHYLNGDPLRLRDLRPWRPSPCPIGLMGPGSSSVSEGCGPEALGVQRVQNRWDPVAQGAAEGYRSRTDSPRRWGRSFGDSYVPSPYSFGAERLLSLLIEFATDIKAVYPEKKVTLLHSRTQLLPKFDQAMHDESA